MWRVLTSRADNNDVDSEPVVSGGVVAVGTNAGLAAGYDTATGRPVWRHRTDGPCIRVAPAGQSTALFWAGGRLELLAVSTGDRHGRWQRRHHAVDVACAAGDVVLVTTRRVWGRERHHWPVAELRAYRGDHELYAQTYPRWCGPALRYEPATRRVYEAGPRGLGVLDPRTGERDAVVTIPGDPPADRVSPPWAQDGRLYVAVDDGRVMALRHP